MVLRPVIGVEIHAQIIAKTKLFSRAPNAIGQSANSMVSYFDAAHPGTLPIINKQCVISAVKTALALNCRVNNVSYFDRKHYFYSDLPAGYQITQQRQPIAVDGHVDFVDTLPGARPPGGVWRRARIQQLQLEQDSGKSLHDEENKRTLVDLNRCGVGLMEIVTHPDFTSPSEVAAFVLQLQQTLRAIGTCTGKLEDGCLRVDASVSLHEEGTHLGTRTELKNVSSLRSIRKALDFEIERQRSILESGHEVRNETRFFDASTFETYTLRDKEDLHDYRFLSEPNLPPLRLYTSSKDSSIPKGAKPSQIICISQVASGLPELLTQRLRQISEQYPNMPLSYLLEIQTSNLLDLFTELTKLTEEEEMVCYVGEFLLGPFTEVIEEMKFERKDFAAADELFKIIKLFKDLKLSEASCHKIISELIKDEQISVSDFVRDNNLLEDLAISDSDLEELCRNVLLNAPKKVRQYRGGKHKLMKSFVHNVLKSGKRVEKEQIEQIIKRLIEQS